MRDPNSINFAAIMECAEKKKNSTKSHIQDII